MRIIDRNGKLFGKINIIDFLVVLFILLVLIIGARIIFFHKKSITYAAIQVCEGRDSKGNIFNCGKVPYFIGDAMEKGDVVKSFGKVIAQIVDVDTEDKDESKKDVLIELEMLTDVKKQGLYFRNQELRVNMPISFKTSKINIDGVITKLSSKRINITKPYTEKYVEIFFSNVPPEIFEVLSKGMKSMYNGKVVTEVIDFEAISGVGVNKDVSIKAMLLVKYKEGGFWFEDQKLQVGAPIGLNIGDAYLKGKVMKIFDEEKLEEKTRIPMIVYVEMYNKRSWVAEKIEVGAKEEDSKGNLLAEIINKEVSDAEIEVITESGEVYRKFSPLYKDIRLKVRIYVEKKDGQSLYHNKEVIIGVPILISLPDIEFEGVIVDLI